MLFILASCEQEDALQRSAPSTVDPSLGLSTKRVSPTRNFEMLDMSKVALDRSGYQRVQKNRATGSILYAKVRNKKIIGYQILKSNGRKVQFNPPNGNCPDIYVCIHPETGKYIYYDKCTTENPCRPICTDLTWCIDPVTGHYILYDKCKTETSPCDQGIPPIIIVNKKYKVAQFCPTVDYTWMIDPETGEYVLYTECDFGWNLLLEVGW